MLERILPEHSACTNGSLTEHRYLLFFGSVHDIPSVLSIDMEFLSLDSADVAATAFYEPANIIDYVAQLLNGLNPRQPMKDHERVKVLIYYMHGSQSSNYFYWLL